MTPQERLQMELLKTDLGYSLYINIVLGLALVTVLVYEIAVAVVG